jgi:putative hemolysin
MGLELLIVLFLILLNGFFAMAEMALVSARRAKLRALVRRDKGAKVAVQLADKPSRFLSTVQVGITLIGILAGAFGGTTIAGPVAAWLATFPAVAPYSEGIAIAIVVMVIGFLQLIIGELVPKRLALADPERIAARVSRPMAFLTKILSPAVDALGATSSAIIWALGLRAESTAKVTEEEIRQLVQEGAETGAILSVERDMVNRVFRLGDKLVDDVMTPRPQIVWLDIGVSNQENIRRMREARYSRYPVMKGDIHNCVGVIRAKDLVFEVGKTGPIDLFANMRPPLFVPNTTPALAMLDQFKRAGLHMALVVDEYGDVMGLVTPSDILEAIVGEMAPMPGSTESSIVKRADGSMLIDALLAADELKEKLELAELPGEAEHDFNTLAGLMLARFERIPREGDSFDWQGFRFEVVDMDGRRIDKVLVTPLPKPAEETLH